LLEKWRREHPHDTPPSSRHAVTNFCVYLRTIRGFEAMLWLRKGFGFAGAWTVCEQNQLLSVCFGLLKVNEA